ncbi:phage tail family protein [Staphylococcus gallinarum]|uniref:phage tail family protein n=1 Tax=Staphylococcus gallinarum TaxID=1293 RepID=UPI000E69C948|nr:phage tail family protein [Staphylococcus gallinarum]RIL33021.1 phage tail family protein [Staphylococcus gallinarum]
MLEKTVRMFNNNFETVLTDIPNLTFLDFDEEDVQIKTETTEVTGLDGVLMGASSFSPFKLTLRFFYRGLDTKDYNLLKQRLRGIIYRREPYYVVHSDMPGKKYAVVPVSNGITDVGDRYGTFEIEFSVYKGYSESLRETDKFSLSSGEWQFEGGLLADDEIKYKHDSSSFKIFNGSSDTINPIMRHYLKITVKVDAPKGITIKNNTTGDEFIYKVALSKSKPLILDGVHPIIDKKRVGVNTNYQWLTLAPGYNDIEILGEKISNPSVEFDFNFIYR